MNNTILQLKVRQRLNKLASNDYDNIECWQIVEAFNKGQYDWTRRNLHGSNIPREGDEQSTERIDDFQILLDTVSITSLKKKDYFLTDTLPEDYMRWKRISMVGKNDCCSDRKFKVWLVEQDNIDDILRDINKKPNFNWGETVAVLEGNRIKVYTNNEFDVSDLKLTYYKEPTNIQIKDCKDPYTLNISVADVECQFKNDVTEVLIDEAVKTLAGDIESFNQMTRAQQSVENNN